MAGKARRYYDKFRFRVEIDGATQAGFSKAGPLKGTVEEVEHYEGGSLLPDKSPGRGKFEDITLEYGATDNLELIDNARWAGVLLDTGAAHYDVVVDFAAAEPTPTVAWSWPTPAQTAMPAKTPTPAP